MRNRRKTLLRDHLVPEVTIQSQPYLRPSPCEDLKDFSCGFHLVWLLRGLHPPVVCIFAWFPPSHGYSWCPFHGLHFCGLHFVVVSTLPWFSSLCGSHPPCGYSVVSLPWFALSWFTLCRGFHPPMVCIFTWFPPSLWLLCGVPLMVCTITWFTLCRGFHPLVVTPWCLSWILA